MEGSYLFLNLPQEISFLPKSFFQLLDFLSFRNKLATQLLLFRILGKKANKILTYKTKHETTKIEAINTST